MAKKQKEVDLTTLDLGACIDALYEARAARLDKQHEVEALAAEEGRIKEHLLTQLAENKLEKATGRRATASITRTIAGSIKDWDRFTAYVKKHNAFDLLERRVGQTAFRARIEAGALVPGVEAFPVVNLSLTKSNRGE